MLGRINLRPSLQMTRSPIDNSRALGESESTSNQEVTPETPADNEPQQQHDDQTVVLEQTQPTQAPADPPTAPEEGNTAPEEVDTAPAEIPTAPEEGDTAPPVPNQVSTPVPPRQLHFPYMGRSQACFLFGCLIVIIIALVLRPLSPSTVSTVSPVATAHPIVWPAIEDEICRTHFGQAFQVKTVLGRVENYINHPSDVPLTVMESGPQRVGKDLLCFKVAEGINPHIRACQNETSGMLTCYARHGYGRIPLNGIKDCFDLHSAILPVVTAGRKLGVTPIIQIQELQFARHLGACIPDLVNGLGTTSDGRTASYENTIFFFSMNLFTMFPDSAVDMSDYMKEVGNNLDIKAVTYEEARELNERALDKTGIAERFGLWIMDNAGFIRSKTLWVPFNAHSPSSHRQIFLAALRPYDVQWSDPKLLDLVMHGMDASRGGHEARLLAESLIIRMKEYPNVLSWRILSIDTHHQAKVFATANREAIKVEFDWTIPRVAASKATRK